VGFKHEPSSEDDQVHLYQPEVETPPAVSSPADLFSQQPASTQKLLTAPVAKVPRTRSSSVSSTSSTKAIVLPSCSAPAADGPAKLSKWKRRDIKKHLAGERNRRAKRMGKIHTLRECLCILSCF
jgi:hypothetical protein